MNNMFQARCMVGIVDQDAVYHQAEERGLVYILSPSRIFL